MTLPLPLTDRDRIALTTARRHLETAKVHMNDALRAMPTRRDLIPVSLFREGVENVVSDVEEMLIDTLAYVEDGEGDRHDPASHPKADPLPDERQREHCGWITPRDY